MRLIDADVLIGELHKTYLYDGDARGIVYKKIEEQPTIEPEIIRCKDCKYWNHEVDLTYCERVGWTGTDADDYCSFAERKEDG